MSKYTTEVRFICETFAGYVENVGQSSVTTVLNKSWEKVFDFDFPIFDESYRSVLCKKILRHFYFREIGEETVGLWKVRLETRLNEIMPYYNKLYESELLDFNPLNDISLTKHNTLSKVGTEDNTTDRDDTSKDTFNVTDTNNGGKTDTFNEQNTTNNTKWNLYQDTPQGGLTGVENQNYLTEATKDTLTETKTHTGTVDNVHNDTNKKTGTQQNDFNGTTKFSGETSGLDTFDEYIEGKTGGVSYSKLLKEFRETFLNIDMLVIEDLRDLFINLW